MNHWLKWPAMVGLLCTLAIGSAFATSSWMRTFSGLYLRSPQAGLKNSKCAICHVKPNGTGGVNCYGKLLKGKSPSPAVLKAIESKDADKDGASNIAEIKAGTLPGDPRSKP